MSVSFIFFFLLSLLTIPLLGHFHSSSCTLHKSQRRAGTLQKGNLCCNSSKSKHEVTRSRLIGIWEDKKRVKMWMPTAAKELLIALTLWVHVHTWSQTILPNAKSHCVGVWFSLNLWHLLFGIGYCKSTPATIYSVPKFYFACLILFSLNIVCQFFVTFHIVNYTVIKPLLRIAENK